MFPGTTLFGVILILIIVVSLIILLIRKPHIPLPFSFEGKSSKGKEEVQTVPKPCPHYFGYLGEHPKNTPIPQECGSCTKIVECQVELNTLRTLPRKEETPEKPTPIVQAAESPKVPSESVEVPQITKEKRVSTPSGHPQLRPPDCPHFFGYLRKIPKGIPMPDECFGCPKMVECLYYNAAPE